MTKSPESRCCKRVGDGGVDGVVVSMIVTAGQQLQLEYLQHPDDARIKMKIDDDNDDDDDDTWVPG